MPASRHLPPVRLDLTISLPMIASILAALVAGTSYLNAKFERLDRLQIATADNTKRIDGMQSKLDVIYMNSMRSAPLIQEMARKQ